MDALALNGLVALPTGFVLLTWLLGGRRSDVAAMSVAVVGGLAVLGWSVWAVAVSAVGLDGGTSTCPGSTPSASAGTSVSTASPARWC